MRNRLWKIDTNTGDIFQKSSFSELWKWNKGLQQSKEQTPKRNSQISPRSAGFGVLSVPSSHPRDSLVALTTTIANNHSSPRNQEPGSHWEGHNRGSGPRTSNQRVTGHKYLAPQMVEVASLHGVVRRGTLNKWTWGAYMVTHTHPWHNPSHIQVHAQDDPENLEISLGIILKLFANAKWSPKARVVNCLPQLAWCMPVHTDSFCKSLETYCLLF